VADRRRNALAAIVRAAAALLLVGAAALAFAALAATRPQPARSERADRPRRVTVMVARPVEVRRVWTGYGSAQAQRSADVPARVSAVVVELPAGIAAGRSVREGDLLVRLDESDFRRQVDISAQSIADVEAQLASLETEEASWRRRLEIAEEQVALAQRELDRGTDVETRGAARANEVDLLRRALNAAAGERTATWEELDKVPARRRGLVARRDGFAAQQRLAEDGLARCAIRSPLSGVLQAVDLEIGESVVPGQRVARVVDLRLIEVPVRLAASARAGVAAGDHVEMRARGTAPRTWLGRVARIAPEDDPATRTFEVFVEIEQDPARADLLAPGRFVEASVRASPPLERFAVPRRALRGDAVLLVEDGRIVTRPVEVEFTATALLPSLGLADDQWAVLAAPLPEGALVVTNLSRALVDGLPVEPVTEAVAAGGPPARGATP
jgi:multidrug resistance efflux pump